ncbi:MAG: alpha/beta fold hydrolase [Chloroflexales bacterium]|nr:alpha/beta fold hydrolase [Chloroflexales bacterium]
MERHQGKRHIYPARLHALRNWRLLLIVCVVMAGFPLTSAQATPMQPEQRASVTPAQPSQGPGAVYFPFISAGALTTPPSPARFEPSACSIAPPQGFDVTCGYLSVPESRQQPTEQRLQLAVMIVHATGANPATDPVVFLQGGPGAAAIELTGLLVQSYAPVLEQRDLIMIDQRGTGFSRPVLPCPYPSFPSSQQTLAQRLGLIDTAQQADPIQDAVALLTQCYATLTQAGINVAAYNSAENAADLADLRQALGYERINLIGGSYGTRLALTIMRDHPDALRSVVLDSVYPLQENFQIATYASLDQALQNLFDGCAADAACNAAYPNLATVFDTLVERLNTTPAEVPITDPATDQVITVPFTGDDLTMLLFRLLYDTGIIPVLPKLITDTSQDNYELLSNILSLFFSSAGGLSLGMTTAVQCSEDATFATAEDFRASRAAHPRTQALQYTILYNEAFLDVCAAWNLTTPNPVENEPVTSPIDTLVITGEYDPITPSQWGTLAVETLESSFIVPAYPRGGHVPSVVSPCLASVMAAFLDAPTQEPDSSCLAADAPLPFVTTPEEAMSLLEDSSSVYLP